MGVAIMRDREKDLLVVISIMEIALAHIATMKHKPASFIAGRALELTEGLRPKLETPSGR